MLATESPYPQYFDTDGNPLDGGKLYFGTANQNPEISPITVYWDQAGTQPAAQPIATLNGYPARNGTPALVFANGDYSVTVRNRKGLIVFYSPTSAEFSNDSVLSGLITALQATVAGLASLASLAASAGSTLVGWIQSGAGAVLRNIQDRLRDRVSIFDFMTTAQIADYRSRTASLDHTAPFNAAVAAVNASGGNTELDLPSGILNLTATITVTGPLVLTGVGNAGQGTTGDSTANNGTLIKLNHNGPGFTVTGSAFKARRLGVFRPQAAPGVGWIPAASNYDFNLSSTDTDLDDILLWGSAKGVILNVGGRLRINNLRGQCFNNGITITQATDSVRITNTHFWPFWSQNANVQTYMYANFTALTVKRTDGAFVTDFFSIWHKRAISFEHDASGDATNFKGANFYLDQGGDGIVTETATVGVVAQFSNVNHQGDAAVSGCGIQLKGSSAQIDIGSFASTLAYLNSIRNSDGTGNKLRIGGLYMTQWNAGAGGFGGCDLAGTGNETTIGPNAAIGTPFTGGTAAFTGANPRQGLWKRVAVSGSTGVAGLISFAHGLGYAPGSADVQLTGSNGNKANVISIDSTNINCVVYIGSGTLNSTAVTGVLSLYY